MTRRAPVRDAIVDRDDEHDDPFVIAKSVGKKLCTSCRVWKKLTPEKWYFRPNGKTKDGRCRECTKAYMREYMRRNRGRYTKHPLRGLQGLSEIERAEAVTAFARQHERCFLTAIKFHRERDWLKPTLVRLDGKLRWVIPMLAGIYASSLEGLGKKVGRVVRGLGRVGRLKIESEETKRKTQEMKDRLKREAVKLAELVEAEGG